MKLHAPFSTEDQVREPSPPSGDIAIIGMSGRFPGANNVDALWQLVRSGSDVFRHFSPDEIEDSFSPTVRGSSSYVASRPVLADADLFDAAFFGMMPREAAITDPQQRVFMEIAWEAFEDAGYDPAHCDGLVAVFAGSTLSTYLINNVLSDREKVEEFTSNYQVGCYPIYVGAITDTLATRVAHKLDLRGPAVTLLTACSTSLVCIAEAAHSLLSGRCDMALAGGVSITFPQKRGYLHQAGGMVSPDGICRPFDADAGGTVFGSGAGAVLLKRLGDAVRDNDHIHAVIKGCGVNNDGASKVSYTGPSAEGQAAAIEAAHANAGIAPDSIGYVECHGTATPLGDPIEFLGLAQAYRGVKGRQKCALGSTKGNLGHLDAAAGVTGVIKAALMLREAEIPPLAQFRRINPAIDLDASPFYIQTELTPWRNDGGPRRAGVSSFGIGGTNAHVVMEEPPLAKERYIRAVETAGYHILPLSARSETALGTARRDLGDHLALSPDIDLGDVAFTLQDGRRAFRHRAAAVCCSSGEFISALSAPPIIRNTAGESASDVVFMFPGQGCQYPGMASDLYRSNSDFAGWIDKGAEIIEPRLGRDIRTLICREATGEEADLALKDTQITQPAIFLIEYALAQLWLDRGLRPAAMIGHSVGEFVAAAVSGVLSFEDALNLIGHRGCLMRDCPGGAMLSVRAGEANVRNLLIPNVDIAAINAPRLTLVAGPFDAIAAFESVLANSGVPSSRLHTSHAFHSAMMERVTEPLCHEASKLTFGAPTIPYVSSVTGDWIDDDVRTPDYWGRHCRQTVRFTDGLRTLGRQRRPVLMEVGPGRTLSVFAAQTLPPDDVQTIISCLPNHERPIDDERAIAEAHAKLWVAGAEIAWPHEASARRVSLPTYPFERERHWIDAPVPIGRRDLTQSPSRLPMPSATNSHPLNLETIAMTTEQNPPVADRKPRLETTLRSILCDLSGLKADLIPRDESFLELGFDSLSLGQFSQQVQKNFDIKIPFRQLLGNIPTLEALAVHLDAELPADPLEPMPIAAPVGVASAGAAKNADDTPSESHLASPIATNMPEPSHSLAVATNLGPASGMEDVLRGQLQTMQAIFSQQISALSNAASAQHVQQAPEGPALQPPSAVESERGQSSASMPSSHPAPSIKAPTVATIAATLLEDASPNRFRMHRPGSGNASGEPTPQANAFISDLVTRFGEKNPTSKRLTQDHRARLADPRTAAGFRPAWKDAVFPIVAESAKGSRIRDVDGNDYVDIVCGYGQCAFGHSPDFVLEAVEAQMQKGFAIGPQSALAGEVAEEIGRMTGHERVTFCNTGSEAVMAAMRVARCVTARDRIVVFRNDYHGQFDEVLIKGGRAGLANALPIAPGIPVGSVSNMTVLPYGGAESLEWISAHAREIAAVIIEPVQSRHPELRPVEFVRELRAITARTGIALVFDEVVSGFRAAPGGVQELWGIKGDMATYGKVLGGGMPLGVLAGDSSFMDALDGGMWRYGDVSEPETSPTFFAGTFVRHPLTLAAARAVLRHIAADGKALYDGVAARTAELVEEINGDLERRGVPAKAECFSSWFNINFGHDDPLGGIIYTQFRQMGLHIQEGFPCYLTTAHSEEDFAFIAKVFRDGVDAVQAAGILCPEGGKPLPLTSISTEPPPHTELRSVPLTQSQLEIWLAAQMAPEASAAFNESFSLTLDGPLDEMALQTALLDVVELHDALRMVFSPDGTSQSVTTACPLDVTVITCSGSVDEAKVLDDLLSEEARTPFDLVAAPPVRATLVRFSADRHVLVFTAHHIVCDGWSGNIVAEELAVAYTERVAGEAPAFRETLSFLRHAEDEAQAIPASSETQSYWVDLYQTIPDPIDLPFDRPRIEQRSFHGATYTRRLDAAALMQARKAGARHGCTLFSTLLGTLQILLSRLSGQEDFAIAIPSAGQSLDGKEGLVGHCVNLLPIRTFVSGEASVEDHLKSVQTSVSEAFEHRDYTYGTLVRRLAIKRSPAMLPLTQVQFNLERIPGALAFGDIAARMTPNPKAFSNFDLFINMMEGPDGLRIDADYNTDILDKTTVARWLDCFEVLLDAIGDETADAVGSLPIVPSTEVRWLIDEVNRAEVPLKPEETVLEMIRRQSSKRPDAVAVMSREGDLTYKTLEERSNQFASHLHQCVNEPGQRIALALDRSATMVVALLGIMKAGHAYIPLDPDHPEARLNQAMTSARIAALVTDQDRLASMAPIGTVLIRPDLEAEAIAGRDTAPFRDLAINGESPAYVIFTSGSTGQPKGVEVPHRALANFLHSMAREPGFEVSDRIVALTTISFDIAALELYLPLVCGGATVIAERSEVTDAFALVDRIKACDATVLQATPTLWRMLIEAGFEPGPKIKMLCGGEALPRDLADRLTQNSGELWNMYGPTETTIWSSIERVSAGGGPITIGHPIDNTTLHILSPGGQLQPVGAIGALHIGGTGLANGYFDRPDLTAASFHEIALPGQPIQRLYNTGDLGVRHADGSLLLLGRRDQQVKLRGFRIELGDIEAVLRKVDGVQDAAVDLKTRVNGEPQLVGYYVADPESELDQARLVGDVSAALPAYMVPSAWVRLDEFPQTGNGKLDRQALPMPASAAIVAAAEIRQPRPGLETQLADIWKHVLALGEIDVRANIFALGADSLSVFRIAARMMDEGLHLDASDILKNPTIEGLAKRAASVASEGLAARSSINLRDFRGGARRQIARTA